MEIEDIDWKVLRLIAVVIFVLLSAAALPLVGLLFVVKWLFF